MAEPRVASKAFSDVVEARAKASASKAFSYGVEAWAKASSVSAKHVAAHDVAADDYPKAASSLSSLSLQQTPQKSSKRSSSSTPSTPYVSPEDTKMALFKKQFDVNQVV